jgi:secreted trypsin-like serine protease
MRHSLFAPALGLVLLACSSGPPAAENLGEGREAIINGEQSTTDQDMVVLIGVTYQGKVEPECSGSLVAKNLVMTARHCVGDLDDAETSVTNYANPSVLKVFIGGDAPKKLASNSTPAASGKKIITANTTKLYPDVAFIVLDKEVTGAKIANIRLDGGVTIGEKLTIVGFGLTESNALPSTRMQRTDVSVTDVADVASAGAGLDPGEFVFGEAACSGDSGGPALDAKTKAVVGVASRVGNGKQPTQTDPSAFCVGADTEDVYTSLQPVKDLLQQAFTAAGATPALEGQSTPPDTATPPDDPSDPASSDDGTSDPAPAPKKKTVSQVSNAGCSAAPSGNGDESGMALVALALALVGCRGARRARRPQN